MRLTIIFLFLLTPIVVLAYPKQVDDLFIELYSSSYKPEENITLNKMIEEVESLKGSDIERATYINIAEEFKVRVDFNVKEEKKIKLKEIRSVLKDTEALKASKNSNQDPTIAVDYMTSRANLLVAAIGYGSLLNIQSLVSEAEKLYVNSLLISPDSFMTLFSYAMATTFKPKIVGGGMEAAMPLFLKARENARLDYEKFMIYIWLSQVFFEMDDMSSYNKFLGMATVIYPKSFMLKLSKGLNAKKDTLFDQ